MKQSSDRQEIHSNGESSLSVRREPDAYVRLVNSVSLRGSATMAARASHPAKLDRWKERLVQRGYGRWARPFPFQELSAFVEHGGAGFYFPLGTEIQEEAAARAQEIYQGVLSEGWPSVLRRYPREFTLAIVWSENPMVFTYATLYTVPDCPVYPAPSLPPRPQQGAAVSVAIVEPNRACRLALGNWIGGLPGYSCRGLFSAGEEALSDLKRIPVDLLLLNRQAPGLPAKRHLESPLGGVASDIPALGYRIYDTSDELFVSQPGVSGGYYFRRRTPQDLLEPIRDAWNGRSPTPVEWHARVCGYVQRLFFPAGAAGPLVSPLTSRENDILGCLCRGIPDKEIACTLNISVWTVHTHLKRIYEKLGVRSRAEAMLKFLHG